MSVRNNVIEQIASVKARMHSQLPRYEMPSRMTSIKLAFKDSDKKNGELLRYYPVALIATLESYFRLAIANLIDSGSPWLENSAEIMARTKIEFDVVRAFHGKLITIGEYVGATVSITNIAGLNATMSALLATDYLTALSTTIDRWAAQGAKDKVAPIITDPDATYRNVEKTFELRHIFCHEAATGQKVTTDEIAACIEHTALFLKASEELISDTIHPNAPLTQADMNIYSYKQAMERRAELDLAEKELIQSLNDEQRGEYAQIQQLWEQLRNASVGFEGAQYKGGSIQPLIHNLASKRMTEDRIEQVRRLVESFKHH
ncbi:MAG TPA: lysozyme inhibitor LprI family protein [Gammaproteobacteria bacterium]|nr:lysozyme inhibitor LprI family protein [Gammaproteobacteria bacterium]